MELNKESGHDPQGPGNGESASSRPGDGAICWCHQDERIPHPFDAFCFYPTPHLKAPVLAAVGSRHITLKVSRTTICAPPCNTGQPLALATASSSESAWMIE